MTKSVSSSCRLPLLVAIDRHNELCRQKASLTPVNVQLFPLLNLNIHPRPAGPISGLDWCAHLHKCNCKRFQFSFNLVGGGLNKLKKITETHDTEKPESILICYFRLSIIIGAVCIRFSFNFDQAVFSWT